MLICPFILAAADEVFWTTSKGMFGKIFTQRRIYLDFASATPIKKEVTQAMAPFASEVFGNASAIHEEGRKSAEALLNARARIGKVLVTRTNDIIFTSGGTESNNLAIIGVIEAKKKSGVEYADMEVVTTAIEHPSVLEVVRFLERRGVFVVYAPIDSEGRIIEKEFKALLSPKTVLVTFAYANSEVGTVQDVKVLSRTVRLYRKEQNNSVYPYLHLDASQAPLYLPCRMDSLGVDLMSIDAGKCYGPKGVGVLALRGDIALSSVVHGGSQERGLRPGTVNVALAVGCATALLLAEAHFEERVQKVTSLREFFAEKLAETFSGIVINGSREHRIANNLNISIPDVDGEYAVIGLDTRGIAASTRSACKTNDPIEGKGGSHVLRALGASDDVVLGAIRFSLCEHTTKKELQTTIAALKEHIEVTKPPKLLGDVPYITRIH